MGHSNGKVKLAFYQFTHTYFFVFKEKINYFSKKTKTCFLCHVVDSDLKVNDFCNFDLSYLSKLVQCNNIDCILVSWPDCESTLLGSP